MHSIKNCIPKDFLLSEQQLQRALNIIADIGYYKQTGRPPIPAENVLFAVYYLAKTGMQWNALPMCFGSSSTIHAAFQRLVYLGFFDNFFIEGLEEYNQKIGLELHKKTGDCTHVKNPMGRGSSGPSPVDRRKQGSKRSIITDGNGIMLGCVVAAGNRNDAKLLNATIQSIPRQFHSDGSHQIWLDGIYDTKEVKTICFMHGLIPRISRNTRRKAVGPTRLVPKGVRWVVERAHSWINRFRRLFIRYEKSDENHVALVNFASATHTFSKAGVSG